GARERVLEHRRPHARGQARDPLGDRGRVDLHPRGGRGGGRLGDQPVQQVGVRLGGGADRPAGVGGEQRERGEERQLPPQQRRLVGGGGVDVEPRAAQQLLRVDAGPLPLGGERVLDER